MNKNVIIILLFWSNLLLAQSVTISTDSIGVKNAKNIGIAGRFENLNAGNPNSAIKGITNGTGIAIDGLQNGTSGRDAGFWINNTSNASESISAGTQGMGKAALFGIYNQGNTSNALEAETNGNGHALQAFNRGNGPGGNFTITKNTNNNIALYGYTYGTGNAGDFYINNSSSSSPSI